ncbi:hypothetical protein [Novosphingobium sp. CF614]|uniref:hypothetical protein n=1 Tax=Novosphingobium sp. CF614 TaxID=1884364 RepID=UPI002100A2E7|nr:hypothetical protein [Novosphingobium sp. CF614]
MRLTEPCLSPADCGSCVLRRSCGLTAMLGRAMAAFLAELDGQTLAEAAAQSRLPAAFTAAGTRDPLPAFTRGEEKHHEHRS